MELITKMYFLTATHVTDHFQFQQSAKESLLEIRIKYRWKAIDAENKATEKTKSSKKQFGPIILSNGDTVKQLFVRSRYVLYRKRTS